MAYSLINVDRTDSNGISGNWVQDHIGTLEGAVAKARATEAVNSNKIDIAVVEGISGWCCPGEYFSSLRRLDTKRHHAQESRI